MSAQDVKAIKPQHIQKIPSQQLNSQSRDLLTLIFHSFTHLLRLSLRQRHCCAKCEMCKKTFYVSVEENLCGGHITQTSN